MRRVTGHLSILLCAIGLAAASPRAQSPAAAATTVRDGFTLASVGDLIVAYPQSDNPDEAFQGVLKLIRGADVATDNYEGNIIDGRHFKGSTAYPGGFGGVPEVAADIRKMGWSLLARSNNHAGEFGPEGMQETNRRLEDAGVMYAGAGDTYWAARASRYVATSKGRVGMVSTASTYAPNVMAEPARGEWPGHGGQSALRTTRIYVCPPSLWQSLMNVRNAFPSGASWYAPGFTEKTATLLGERFTLDSTATKPHYSYQMNQQDLRDILAMVREGKTRSDFMTVAIHAHHFYDTIGGERGPGVPENESIDTNPSIADYLPVFAKAAIDAGADAFLGTGVHVLRGIEIYKGRPIFYGLGEFFRQMDVIGLAGMRAGADVSGDPGAGGESDPPIKYESIVALSRFDHGRLTEVRLHPVELTNQGVPLAQRGIPRLASPEGARGILTRLQRLSVPLGTNIVIDGSVGVIRAATSGSAQ
jgi:poly-gamma-glutamate synthesis protein (capsule biosynthesis protein)